MISCSFGKGNHSFTGKTASLTADGENSPERFEILRLTDVFSHVTVKVSRLFGNLSQMSDAHFIMQIEDSRMPDEVSA